MILVASFAIIMTIYVLTITFDWKNRIGALRQRETQMHLRQTPESQPQTLQPPISQHQYPYVSPLSQEMDMTDFKCDESLKIKFVLSQ